MSAKTKGLFSSPHQADRPSGKLAALLPSLLAVLLAAAPAVAGPPDAEAPKRDTPAQGDIFPFPWQQ
jgi:hypothetical protein